ncbi:MAG: hypothetical protein JNM13_15220 [Hyphomicrobiaceae bacterium]|nr:hypothetical protein [Hyphomicrobiaceae bacterium]
MAFLPLLLGRSRGERHPIRLYFSQSRGGRADRLFLTVVMSRAQVEKMGWQGGDYLVIAIGSGGDAGKVQLSKSRRRAGNRLIANSNCAGFRVMFTLPHVANGLRIIDMFAGQQSPITPAIECDGQTIRADLLMLDASEVGAPSNVVDIASRAGLNPTSIEVA